MAFAFRYYVIQNRATSRPSVIYVARSEKERDDVLSWFKEVDRKHLVKLDVTRSTRLPKSKQGFQCLEFWVGHQNMVVNG